ncbi:hypothetical protein A0H81_14086 [Grifola frondosa]|uniref:Uncharacterized protein n=1 Tax=Grifola frondosa TaxID=5627 RepID=A0A1C7LM49_GRIFR|nr:hypothetical protein A0H81_14086 [Grifola frondosa]
MPFGRKLQTLTVTDKLDIANPDAIGQFVNHLFPNIQAQMYSVVDPVVGWDAVLESGWRMPKNQEGRTGPRGKQAGTAKEVGHMP